METINIQIENKDLENKDFKNQDFQNEELENEELENEDIENEILQMLNELSETWVMSPMVYDEKVEKLFNLAIETLNNVILLVPRDYKYFVNILIELLNIKKSFLCSSPEVIYDKLLVILNVQIYLPNPSVEWSDNLWNEIISNCIKIKKYIEIKL